MHVRRFGPSVLAFTFLLLFGPLAPGQVHVIFDTDMGNDVDDALALAMLHALTNSRECRLIGVTLTNANPLAVPFVRMVNAFYGRPDLPVGAARKLLPDGARDRYLKATLDSAPASLKPNSGAAESGVVLLRRLLATSPRKVVIVQVGFSTNLAALLDSPADAISPLTGIELAKKKVKLLSAMAGNFVEQKPEYNVRLDVEAARSLFARWPTPVIFSGYEIGRSLLYPATSIERDFSYVDWHPIATAYRAYNQMPYDRATYDLTSVLEAVRPRHGYFRRSAKGQVGVRDDTTTTFERGGGNRQYLILDDAKRQLVLDALTKLSSAPPMPTVTRR